MGGFPPLDEALSFYPTQSRVIIENALHRAIHHAKPFDHEVEFTTVRGRTIGRPVIRNGKVVRLSRASQNVTEKRATEFAAKTAKESLDLVIEGADLGTWDWHIDKNIVLYNDRCRTMLGYEADELGNSPAVFFDNLLPDDRQKVERAIQDYISGYLKEYALDVRLRMKSGDYRWVLALAMAAAAFTRQRDY